MTRNEGPSARENAPAPVMRLATEMTPPLLADPGLIAFLAMMAATVGGLTLWGFADYVELFDTMVGQWLFAAVLMVLVMATIEVMARLPERIAARAHVPYGTAKAQEFSHREWFFTGNDHDQIREAIEGAYAVTVLRHNGGRRWLVRDMAGGVREGKVVLIGDPGHDGVEAILALDEPFAVPAAHVEPGVALA